MSLAKFDSPYNPSETESKIYDTWLKSGYFNPDKLPNAKKRKPFSIALPPPNVTGVLHMGHAFEDTIQDAIIRFQRMQGKKALWLPGTDHAAIATQAKFEKDLYKKEKKSRHDFSRKKFFEMIQNFALENKQGILSQLHKLGLSLDWSRLAFTLDKDREKAVRTAFKTMFEEGLIYRDYRVVNWDPKGQTTVSDDEIEYEETKTKLYTFRYSKDFPIPIATTRPETKLGDTAVAVHPDDNEYRKFIGQSFDVDFCGMPLHIKVISDKSVDTKFGTRALGVTPAHSLVDFEMAQRHKLPIKPVIDEFAKIMVGGERLQGKKTSQAREIIAEMLRESGLMEKEEEIVNSISKAQRTGGIIEPLPKLQWFIAVNKKFVLKQSKIKGIQSDTKTTLKEIMKKTVASGQIKILPERFEKTYYHWIDNLRDWCISRQIIYGHQISAFFDITDINNQEALLHYPNGIISDSKIQNFLKHYVVNTINKEGTKKANTLVYFNDLKGHYGLSFRLANELCKQGLIGWGELKKYTAIDPKGSATPKILLNKPKEEYMFQDLDTLDTWFSSGLWTFSTLGWPEKTADLKAYHPTAVMMPGYEILFFWVARMILMSGFLLGDIPFQQVVLHGMVRDKQGRKFSKSLNNGVDPLEITAKYGTDALHMALVFGSAPGNDLVFDEQKVAGMKKFANKLWNISRFVLNVIPEATKRSEGLPGIQKLDSRLHEDNKLTPADKVILKKLEETVKSVTKNIENFNLHEAAQTIYQFTWHGFADIYIEVSKEQLKNKELKEGTTTVLLYCLSTILKLLHPFMPFITEEIWAELKQKDLLIVAEWPTSAHIK